MGSCRALLNKFLIDTGMSSSALLTQCQRQLHHNIGFAHGFSKRGFATVTDVPKTHRLAVGILLNRAPFLTRTPSKFEREFYKYQQRIYRSLHNPFPYEFYFKQGSLLESQFVEEEVEEKQAMLMKLEKTTGEEDERTAPRRTEADEKKDVKSLDRHGARNLYLLVKGSPKDKYEWRFPKGHIRTGEALHEAAKRDLHAECGPNMNSWVVGRQPIGLFEYEYENSASSQYAGEKMFFYKAHIFNGQVRTAEEGITDFAWLTKEEIEPFVAKDYWLGTKDMLSDF
ncbi:hypothetical protein EW145_g5242 [Phellinidium pouzarii]|uniref:Large ribosomal subunit protein mL46 n=1 Tax=Phellinidium pouzarii TaxID=167371 RepID=A0A4S4L0V0_9AGAM|nr:hypothetical protein EW145_g5242 [Phellinidium pouzarii]